MNDLAPGGQNYVWREEYCWNQHKTRQKKVGIDFMTFTPAHLTKAAETAAANRAARKALGLRATKTPVERLKERSSLRRAVNAMCWQCEGEDSDPGVRWRIGNCSIEQCALWTVRPHQTMCGRPRPKTLELADQK